MISTICDIIILIAAVLLAITNIWKFFTNSGKGIKKRVDQAAEEKEREFNEKVDARALEIVKPLLEQ